MPAAHLFCNLKVWFQDGSVWVSPNASYLPDVPLRGLKTNQSEFDEFVSFQRPQWHDEDMSYVPFLPLKTPSLFVAPLFQRLNFDRLGVPISADGSEWQMIPPLKEEWDLLEKVLVICIHLISTEGHWMEPVLPRQFGYMRSFRNTRGVQRRVINSRHAFLLLMALLSYTIAWYASDRYGTERNDMSGPPRWYLHLAGAKVVPQWLDALSATWVPDWETPRVGVFVDIVNAPILGLTQYLRTNVPVWYTWNIDQQEYVRCKPSEAYWAPTAEQVQAAHLIFPPLPSSIHDLHDGHLDPMQVEGARARQALEKFLETRNVRHRIRQLADPTLRLQGRSPVSNTEESTGEQIDPLPTAAKIYHWVSDGAGGYERILFPRGDIPRALSFYKPSQRRYNPYDNEWDLCAEFDSELALDLMGDGCEDDDDEAIRTDEVLELDIAHHSLYWSQDIEIMFGSVCEPSSFIPHSEEVLAVLTFRYGFVPLPSDVPKMRMTL